MLLIPSWTAPIRVGSALLFNVVARNRPEGCGRLHEYDHLWVPSFHDSRGVR